MATEFEVIVVGAGPAGIFAALEARALRSAACLANLLGGQVLVQRLGELRAGCRSTPARIRDGRVVPSLEVKLYSLPLRVSPWMECPIENLFAPGDGAGVSRGLVQSSASGVLAGREVARRLSAPARRQAANPQLTF